MPIPASQLTTWSRRPDPGRSAATYSTVRTVLRGPTLARYRPNVYLQGSYANSTNIRADSDVDVVAQLSASWRQDLSALPTAEAARYHESYNDSSITLTQFRQDVEDVLRRRYPNQVRVGNKCIKVAGTSSRLPLDVLPAQEYRLYRSFRSRAAEEYVPGILFVDRAGNTVINYPIPHRQNGEVKQARTVDRYKQLVRTVKNARRKLRDDGALDSSTSPSYFLECLLYHVPNDHFVANLQSTYLNVLNWLNDNQYNLSGLLCQNGVTPLFGYRSTEWNTTDARRLIDALIDQWNTWR